MSKLNKTYNEPTNIVKTKEPILDSVEILHPSESILPRCCLNQNRINSNKESKQLQNNLILKCLSQNKTELLKIINSKNLNNMQYVKLFYNYYADLKLQQEIQNLINKNSNYTIKKEIFSKTINEIVHDFQHNFIEIQSIHPEYIEGFVKCNNNSVFKIKEYIAQQSTNDNIINILLTEIKEIKILKALASNKNINDDVEVQLIQLAIKYNYKELSKSLLTFRNLNLESVQNILFHFQSMDLINILRVKLNHNNYDNKVAEWITVNFKEYNITVKNYDEISPYYLLNFAKTAKLSFYDDELIKRLCTDNNMNLQISLLSNNQNSLKIRFFIFIYAQHLKNKIFRDNDLLNEIIKNSNNQDLINLIELSKRGEFSQIKEYIKSDFSNIDKEILIGYSMTSIDEFSSIRAMICFMTIDFEIMDTISLNSNDINSLSLLLKKPKENLEFRNFLYKKENKYKFTRIISRILNYKTIYNKNAKYNLINILASDYFYSNAYMKEQIFNDYVIPNNDLYLLCLLYKSLKNNQHNQFSAIKYKMEMLLNKLKYKRNK